MPRRPRLPRFLALPALVTWLFLFFTAPAHAYLDPTSGSLMLQALLGGFAGLGMMVRLLVSRLRR